MSKLPPFYLESRDFLKVLFIASDENIVSCQGDGGDENIYCVNRVML